MDSSTIELPGSEISGVTIDGETICVHFERVIITKTMAGAFERTRWWQQGDLVFEGAQLIDDLPSFPAVCSGGDVGENVYTYRNMIPIPLESRGAAHCDLKIEGGNQHLRIQAQAVRLDMIDVPNYIEHIAAE
ncbi:MAG: hypothetical protein IZT60_03515 [Gammaproteobacteria bacterium]|nr:hypothetical protein [Gammaproteobacteria bacterium]